MNRRKDSGFTLVEVTIILLVLIVLAAILLPVAERFVDKARIVRVREDIGVLVAIVELWKCDNCTLWFHQDGDSNAFTSANRVDMLVGDGDIPSISPLLTGEDDNWNEAIDAVNSDAGVVVDTISNHLALGDPFFPTENTAATSEYPIPSSPSVFACGFRGAYISTPVVADPWGNRYMINVAFLGPRGLRPLGTTTQIEFNQYDVFVLSAGPDETVQTAWQPGTPPITGGNGTVAQGDDQIAIINGGS